MSQTTSQSQAAPQKPAPSQLQESLLGYLVDTCVKRPYFALQGRRHRRKIDVVIEEIEATTKPLDSKRDRIGAAGFHSGYTTFLAPTHDFRRLRPALKKARQATLDTTPRGSRLFPAIGEFEDAFRAYSSSERIQIGVVLSDGADTSGESAEDAGRRSQEFMLGPFTRRHITLIGIGKDQSVSYGSLGRYSKTANLVMHDELYGLAAVVTPIIHRVVAWAITKATPADIVASLGWATRKQTLPESSPELTWSTSSIAHLRCATTPRAAPSSPDTTQRESPMNVQDIPISLIDPHPANPAGRVAETEELLALLENIRTRGLLFPIRVVREHKTARYTVVAGHRRLWCKRRPEHQDIACIVEDGPVKDGDVLIDQISENVHRAAYKPVEQARLFRLLQEQLKLNNKQMAKRLNYSEGSVSMYLSILKLPAELLDAIDNERLAFSTAVEIVKVENPKVRDDLAQRAMQGASRAEVIAAIIGDKPKAKRLTLRRGDLTVTALEKLTPAAVARGLEELLKKARKAATEGHGLDSLTHRPQPEEAA